MMEFTCEPANQARTGEGVSTASLKFQLDPAMPDPYTPCGRTTPQTVLRPFGGRPARRAGGLRPSLTFWTPPYAVGEFHDQGDAATDRPGRA
jgi:hypothetical protein